jgi:hypothetical protein
VSRAEYMRNYRAKRLLAAKVEAAEHFRSYDKDDRIAELEAEVKHLKAELAERPLCPVAKRHYERDHSTFNSRPFTPAPKGK